MLHPHGIALSYQLTAFAVGTNMVEWSSLQHSRIPIDAEIGQGHLNEQTLLDGHYVFAHLPSTLDW